MLLALLVCIGLLIHHPPGSDGHQLVPAAVSASESPNILDAGVPLVLPASGADDSAADIGLLASAVCVFLLTLAATLAIRRVGGSELRFLADIRRVANRQLPKLLGSSLPQLIPLRI